jgi:hypothetical protein
MSIRALVIAVVVAVVLAAALSMLVGTLIGPLIAVSLVAGAVLGGQVARQVTPATASRALARGSLAVLITLGVVFRTVLVGNPSDNAYLWIAVLGMLLFFPAVPFALAAIVPRGRATSWLMRAGIVLFWLIGGGGLSLLGIGGGLYLTSTPPGIAMDSRVPIFHGIGFVLLLGALYLVGFYWPRIPAPDRAGPRSAA